MDIPLEPVPNRQRYLYAGGGVVVMIMVIVYVAGLDSAAPSVDRSAIWTDTVRRGDMLRQVRGPGTLVPERIRIVTAVTSGRVEAVPLQPGAEVEPETILLELSNPDVQLEVLDAQRQLSSAEAELMSLRSSLEIQSLSQEAAVASIQAEYREALRQLEAGRTLADQNIIPRLEFARLEDRGTELEKRVEVEERRLEVMRTTQPGQLLVKENQVDRLRDLAAFREDQASSMSLTAGAYGVLQQLSLQVGQWVTPGQELSRIVEPGGLKAVLRVPETQAREVSIGQKATVDTRNGIIRGRVARIDPAVQNGSVVVDVTLDGPLPTGARPDLSVDGVIEIERLDDVLHVQRPTYGRADSEITLFRMEEGGRGAVPATVRLGRSSVDMIEIVEGLEEGDVIILSDMSAWLSFPRVRIE